LRPAGLPDLAEILTWIPDAPALERWAGPGKTFPTRPELLWQEIKATHENAFALAQGDRLLGFGQLLPRPGGASFHLARIIISPRYRGRDNRSSNSSRRGKLGDADCLHACLRSAGPCCGISARYE